MLIFSVLFQSNILTVALAAQCLGFSQNRTSYNTGISIKADGVDSAESLGNDFNVGSELGIVKKKK